ncbi:uncharacterized protein LOC103487569 isoform X1 [Cucumis melo]|uniref:Uncharacterized protein LOC103487569 isoform X1 n=1 Tax=Cucumis melo TaxID=3656 RepID=A0ABM3L0D4_CUCME|nr:uncharacterized protein LOC103487569 isoform X1 [Cucumis melo]XP_050943497.1 uncharacterized protein LOC103487569 isoform X1 [Cucumis melo]
MSVFGWYGPLIDLSEAALHVGGFVQLLVFIHRSTPVEYKLTSGGDVIRTDIKVADDTRSFFSVSLWQKKMAAAAIPGDVVLLQNVKLRKFGDSTEATTVHCSSLECIIHPYETLVSEGVDELTANCRAGLAAKEKLRKVVEWAKGAGSTFHNIRLPSDQKTNQFFRNWKLPEKGMSRDYLLLSEVSCLTESCKVIFDASIGEIFLLTPWMNLDELRKEKLFVSRRLSNDEDFGLAEDLICTGCQLCGSPLGLENGYERSVDNQISVPLCCSKSLNRLHVVSMIYRPFMLYVWDESEYLPLLVKNQAAEILFGNIKAEKIYSHYSWHKSNSHPNTNAVSESSHSSAPIGNSPRAFENGERPSKTLYQIWLILLKMLLEQGKNSPLKFEVTVNTSMDKENGRFEMVSSTFPCSLLINRSLD